MLHWTPAACLHVCCMSACLSFVACWFACLSAVCLSVSSFLAGPLLLPSSPPPGRLLLPSPPVCVACWSISSSPPADCLIPWLLCRGPAMGCFLEGWGGALLYHSFLSWSLLCRSLATSPFTSKLDSYAPCEQDDQGVDHFSLTRNVGLVCRIHFHAGMGCMFLGPAWGGLAGDMLQSCLWYGLLV